MRCRPRRRRETKCCRPCQAGVRPRLRPVIPPNLSDDGGACDVGDMTWVLLSRRSSALLVVAAVAMLAPAGDAAAQPSWTRVDSAGPLARIIPALTFDGT